MIRWVDDERTVELAVRDLVGRNPGVSGLVMSRGGRARAGVRAHAEADSEGEREVSWRHVEEVLGWRCVLRARVDGVVDLDDGATTVEELKSVALPESELATMDIPLAWRRQLGAYLHIARAMRLPEPVGLLRLVSLVDGSQRLVPQQHDPAMGDWLRAWLAARIRARESWLSWRDLRRRRTVPFPHPQPREGQDRMQRLSEEALHQGAVQCIEAPTGVGKTAPVLAGALRAAFALDLGLFWATARGTQRWIVERTLAGFREAGLPLRSVVVPARSELCPACAAGDCVGTAELAELDALAEVGAVDALLLRREAARQDACPWALAVEYAAHLADVVVGDLNYAFEPDIHLRPLFGAGAARRWAVLVDEAHQLPERARGWASAVLTAGACAEVELAYPGPDGTPFRQVAAQIRGLIGEPEAAPGAWSGPDPDALAELVALAERLDALAIAHLLHRRGQPDPDSDPWPDFARSLQVVAAWHDHAGEEIVLAGRPGELRMVCRDPSILLADRFAAAHAVVATSATLEPPWFWRARTGVPSPRFAAERVPSPFPTENRLVLVARGVSTAWRDRGPQTPRIAALLDACAAQVPGNIAIFFGSFDAMERTLALLALPGRERLIQSAGMPPGARDMLAEAMRRPGKALCAVLGGVFGESIDLPAGSLDAAFIVGPSLPPPELESHLLKDWYERQHHDGHGLACVHPGMVRVVQAAGRVVRGPTDRGAVVLICRRFQQHEYQRFFPADWSPIPTSHPDRELAAFFMAKPS